MASSSRQRPNGFILHYDKKKQQLRLTVTGALTVVLVVGALLTVAVMFLMRH